MIKKYFNQKGFTLIELLIVIALLGALAVGLLAAIDPLEQIRKGTDSANRNTTEEVHNAFVRYYAIKSAFPWKVIDDEDSYGSSTITEADGDGYIQPLIDAGELKDDFMDLVGTRTDDVVIYSEDVRHISVCFQPISKSFQSDLHTQYDETGDDGGAADCISQEGDVECYWCVK